MQFLEKEDRISHLELELEEAMSQIGTKGRQLSDHQDQINDLKVELASVREQKNSAMKEVSVILGVGWFYNLLGGYSGWYVAYIFDLLQKCC